MTLEVTNIANRNRFNGPRAQPGSHGDPVSAVFCQWLERPVISSAMSLA
jgi:hypothetical protein